MGNVSKDKYAEKRYDDNILRYAYRLDEDEGDERVAAFYCFAFGESGHVLMAIYFDDEKDVKWAEMIWRSLKEEK